nr:hypothetical protein [Tanacetum cinerariifolium]
SSPTLSSKPFILLVLVPKSSALFKPLAVSSVQWIFLGLQVGKGGGDSVEMAITTDASLVASHDNDNIAKTQSTAMSIDHISQEIGSGRIGWKRETDLMNFIPTTPYDSPLLGGYTLGSDEGRPNLLELISICIKLSNRILSLEEAKSTQDKVITRLKLRVRRLEKKRKARTSQPMKRILFKGRVETSTDKSLGEDASKQRRNDDQTEELNLTNGADTEVIVKDKGSGKKGGSTADQVSTVRPEMRSEKAKEKGVAFRDAEEPPRLTRSTTTLQPLPTIDPKDKDKGVLVEEEPEKLQKVKRRDQGLAQIKSDAELAQRIYKEELTELDRAQKERQKQEEATIAALTEEFDEIQAIMDVDHELASNQHDWNLISWKLYENYGVHTLLMDGTLNCFNMLVEKRYPLIKEMLEKMLNWKLEAKAKSTMTFEILKFIKSHIEE